MGVGDPAPQGVPPWPSPRAPRGQRLGAGGSHTLPSALAQKGRLSPPGSGGGLTLAPGKNVQASRPSANPAREADGGRANPRPLKRNRKWGPKGAGPRRRAPRRGGTPGPAAPKGQLSEGAWVPPRGKRGTLGAPETSEADSSSHRRGESAGASPPRKATAVRPGRSAAPPRGHLDARPAPRTLRASGGFAPPRPSPRS